MSTNKLIPVTVRRRAGETAIVVREKSIASVLADASSILADQIQRLRVESNNCKLDTEEIKNLRTLIQSACDIQREEREQDKHDGLSEQLKNMSEVELLEFFGKDAVEIKKP